ncbi:hypothetical protein HMN09_00416700 [Mycena chlorophos]|uniref:3-carboxymuconate cyclase n=1 Tax=Mycena chlorophos TaxID=658473 RepID=A0A8H6TGI5_MYCCL|nr:hypothetical protein HMN09_00416700 [Mycena chlorophos]
MQLKTTLALSSFLFASTAHGSLTMGAWSSSLAGAAYFMTNEPSGNYIVAGSIESNGKLSLTAAYESYAVGAHGLPNPSGADALFSQGSMAVSQTAGLLAVVNAGSNTVSVFNIDKENPVSLTPVTAPVGSSGDFPQSVAFNAAGTAFCTLNGGSFSSVSCFAVNTKNNTITSIANSVRPLGLNQTTPPTGPPNAASQILFSTDSKQLYVTVKGNPPTPGYMAVWDVAADGSLSESATHVTPPSGGALPFSITPLPGKDALLVTDPALGFDIFDLTKGLSAGVVGGNSTSFTIPGQAAICWSQYSTETGNAYIIDAGTAIVSEINVNSHLTPSIVKQYNLTGAMGTIDSSIATVNKKDYLYVLAALSTEIKVLSLNGAGKATTLQTVDIAGPAKQAGLPVTGSYLQGMATYIKS